MSWISRSESERKLWIVLTFTILLIQEEARVQWHLIIRIEPTGGSKDAQTLVCFHLRRSRRTVKFFSCCSNLPRPLSNPIAACPAKCNFLPPAVAACKPSRIVSFRRRASKFPRQWQSPLRSSAPSWLRFQPFPFPFPSPSASSSVGRQFRYHFRLLELALFCVLCRTSLHGAFSSMDKFSKIGVLTTPDGRHRIIDMNFSLHASDKEFELISNDNRIFCFCRSFYVLSRSHSLWSEDYIPC